jgi:UDP-glucose 4-epimerase
VNLIPTQVDAVAVRVGITGAAGFIGGALVPRLAALGHELVLVDLGTNPKRVEDPRWPILWVDFASAEALGRLTECDVVLHLGAVSGVVACSADPVGSARVNVDGTSRLVDACRQQRVPLAFASSLAVVGEPKELPVTERTPASPTHEYARQKAAGERLVAELDAGDRVPAAIIRMSNVYGTYLVEGRRVEKGNVVQRFVGQARTGTLRVHAPGTQRRDFVHLEDALAHWIAVADRLGRRALDDRAPTYLAASGETYSVLEVAETVARAWGTVHSASSPCEVSLVPNPRAGTEDLAPEFSVDRRWTEAQLGVRCQHHLSNAIEELIRESVPSRERSIG